jgi:hypothetical protein
VASPQEAEGTQKLFYLGGTGEEAVVTETTQKYFLKKSFKFNKILKAECS